MNRWENRDYSRIDRPEINSVLFYPRQNTDYVAASYENKVDSLIIESGFAHTLPLLVTIGVDTDYFDIEERDGLGNDEKIKCFSKPVLIIHAEDDFLIPINQAEMLFAAVSSTNKKILKIPDAGHNDIFFTGQNEYIQALDELLDTVKN